jgi:hypothetical protein
VCVRARVSCVCVCAQTLSLCVVGVLSCGGAWRRGPTGGSGPTGGTCGDLRRCRFVVFWHTCRNHINFASAEDPKGMESWRGAPPEVPAEWRESGRAELAAGLRSGAGSPAPAYVWFEAGRRRSLAFAPAHERFQSLASRIRAAAVGCAELESTSAERAFAVGLLLRRTASLPLSQAACFIGGGTFVPCDPSWPAARSLGILEEAGAAVVLVDAAGGPQSEPRLQPLVDSLLRRQAPTAVLFLDECRCLGMARCAGCLGEGRYKAEAGRIGLCLLVDDECRPAAKARRVSLRYHPLAGRPRIDTASASLPLLPVSHQSTPHSPPICSLPTTRSLALALPLPPDFSVSASPPSLLQPPLHSHSMLDSSSNVCRRRPMGNWEGRKTSRRRVMLLPIPALQSDQTHSRTLSLSHLTHIATRLPSVPL